MLAELSAMVSNHSNSEVEDISFSTIRFKNGAVGAMIASLLHHREEQEIIIDAANGSVEIPHKVSADRQQQNGYPETDDAAYEQLERIFSSLPDLLWCEHCGQIENMISSIENGSNLLVSGVDGRKIVEFISPVYQSAFTGEKILFPMTQDDLFYTKSGLLSKAVKFHQKTKGVGNYADTGIKVGGTL